MRSLQKALLYQGQPGPETGGFTGPHLSRLRLSAQTGYYADLKQLIEHAVEINSSRQATLVAHSQGALVALYFMAKQPSEWVRTHIAASSPSPLPGLAQSAR